MPYAGEDYGSNGAWSGNAAGAAGAPTMGSLSTSHASAVVVLAALGILIAIRLGFRGVDVGGLSVGVR